MECIYINDKDVWNRFISQNSEIDGGFLQTWQWGEFQKAYGRRVWRVGVVEGGEIIMGWQIIEITLPFSLCYFYVPRPVWNQESPHQNKFGTGQARIKNQEFVSNSSRPPLILRGGAKSEVPPLNIRGGEGGVMNLVKEVKKLAKKEKAIFIREEGNDGLEQFGFKKVDISIQPQEELILDITKSEEQLLAEMKPKTRYNFRLAEKHGVEINSPILPLLYKRGVGGVTSIIDIFWNLIQKTSQRRGIRPHPKEYYKKMLDVLAKDDIARLYVAEYQGKIVAAHIVIFFNKTATYLHGGSDDEYKNVMAPYLLHWKEILDAKAQGYTLYNFGGVSSTKKSWEGITRFKAGFSPKTPFTAYGGVWDFPIDRLLYSVYRTVKKMKNKIFFKNQTVRKLSLRGAKRRSNPNLGYK